MQVVNFPEPVGSQSYYDHRPVRFTSWYSKFNRSHIFGLPPRTIHWMTGLVTGGQFRVNYAGVFAQAPLKFLMSVLIYQKRCPHHVWPKSKFEQYRHRHTRSYKWLTGILIPSLRIKYIISSHSDPVRALWEHCVIRQSVQWCNIGHVSCSNAVEYRLLCMCMYKVHASLPLVSKTKEACSCTQSVSKLTRGAYNKTPSCLFVIIVTTFIMFGLW